MPLRHEDHGISMTFLADGKFLISGCDDGYIYTWDVSAFTKEASLPSDFVVSSNVDIHSSLGAINNKPVPVFNPDADAMPCRPREAPQITITKAPRRRVHPGFFGNVPHPVGSSSSASWSQRTLLGSLPTFLHHHRSSQLRELPMVDIACGVHMGSYYAGKKTTARSSRPPDTYVILTAISQRTASLQKPPATALAEPQAVTTAEAIGMSSHPDINITRAGCWTRFLLWIGCVCFHHTRAHIRCIS